MCEIRGPVRVRKEKLALINYSNSKNINVDANSASRFRGSLQYRGNPSGDIYRVYRVFHYPYL